MYASEVKGLSQVFEKVRANLRKGYERNTRSYNLRRREVQFQVGDKVWKRNKVLSNAANKFMSKLAPRYIEATVREKLSPVVYRLSDLNGSDLGKWHVKDLKSLCLN
uniref:Uncharacterized protein LOC114347054 n=1 Tax=Diabrotica virgifera virgifera TaxID=50390 RepID=A0A6P7H788_DIAVI